MIDSWDNIHTICLHFLCQISGQPGADFPPLTFVLHNAISVKNSTGYPHDMTPNCVKDPPVCHVTAASGLVYQ